MKNILYYIIFALWYLLSLLPLRILYVISDMLYYPLYYCIRYRRNIVRKNLVNSFPEKKLEEIVKIEKDFYSFFCDYVVETIKLFSIKESTMRKRMVFKGTEMVNQYLAEGKSCILYLGHYCNWEWISSVPLYYPDSVFCGQIYHPLENKVFNELFLKLRGRFRAKSVSMNETLRKIVSLRREKRRSFMGFISDQVPFWNNIHYWTNFLNQDTPVLTGTERIAKQTDAVVFYASIKRPKRGYYVCEYVKLSDSAQKLPEYELTERYFRALEKDIMLYPQYWLWTHNRWKRTREEFNERFDPETNKIRLT